MEARKDELFKFLTSKYHAKIKRAIEGAARRGLSEKFMNFEKDDFLCEKIDSLVLNKVIERGGSISAEHGLGQYKHIYMHEIKDPATLSTMYAMKNLFDPNRIMNPGKYLPPKD